MSEKKSLPRSFTELSVSLSLLVRCPECEVVTKELHDECRVLVAVLWHVVQLGNSILEGGARHLAGLVGVAQHLVMENREVERKAKTDRMRHCEVLHRNFHSLIVSLAGILGCFGLLTLIGELRDVPVVIAPHFVIEDL